MAAGGAHDPFGSVPRTDRRGSFFSGAQQVASVDDLDAFARRAEPGDEFVYCEAPDRPIPGETTARARELVQAQLLRTHQRRREGGGFQFYVVRTGYKPPQRLSPAEAALADEKADVIFRALKRAANLGNRCPSDTDLMRTAGLTTRTQAMHRVHSLIRAGLIESTLAYENGVPRRVVTIAASKWAGNAGGKSTALPDKWAAAQRAALRDAPAQPQPGQPGRAGAGSPAAPTYPRRHGGGW